MAHLAPELIHETTTSTGTGNLTLAGAVSARRPFSAVLSNNDTFFYSVLHRSAAEYEYGYGTYVSATPAIARTTVRGSSNGGAAVNFSAGTKDVFITIPGFAAGWGVLTVTPSTNQDNYNPSGLDHVSTLNLNIGATMKLTGLAGGIEGRRITLRNTSTDYLLWLENENTASSAANRFKLPKGFPAFMMPGDSITVQYNDTSDRWEVAEWPNQGPAMGLTQFTDFHEGRGGPFDVQVNGTGASVQGSTYLVDTTERPNGVGQLDTGTTAAGRATLGHAENAILPTLGAALHVARLAVETTVSGTETFTVNTGFVDGQGGVVTDGVYWENRWTGSAAEWSQTRAASSAFTRSATNSPTPDNNYIWLVVFVNPGWTRADFIYSTDSVSFTKADSPTTGLPGNTRPTGWAAVCMIKSAGTTQRNCSIDLAGLRPDQVRG